MARFRKPLPSMREIPSSGISLPERKGRSPFSQVGSLLRDPPSQGEKSFSQPFPPWREHVLDMLPLETACGSCICRLVTPSPIPPVPLSPSTHNGHQAITGVSLKVPLLGQFTPAIDLRI